MAVAREPDDHPVSEIIAFNEETHPLASIIIIAWRSAPHLRACLRALVDNVGDVPYEVICILNEPEAGLVEFIERETRGIHTVRTRVNVGYGGAVNLGAKRARGEFTVLLNDDTEILPNWLAPLVDLARRRPTAVAVGSTTLFPDGTIQEAGSVVWSDGSTAKVGRNLPGESRRYDFERRVDHCSGTSLLVRKESWEAIGGMDADAFFPAYYEDTDFCLRLIEAGGEVWYQPRSYVRHLESASTNSSYRRFLFEKNQRVFVERWRDRLRSHLAFDGEDPKMFDEAVWRAMGSPVRVLAVVDDILGTDDLLAALQAGGRCHVALFSEARVVDNTRLSALGIGPVESGERLCVNDHLDLCASHYDLVVDCRDRESRAFDAIDAGCIRSAVLLTLDSMEGDDLHVLVGAQRTSRSPSNYRNFVDTIEHSRGTASGERERGSIG